MRRSILPAAVLILSSLLLAIIAVFSYWQVIRPVGQLILMIAGSLLTASITVTLLRNLNFEPRTRLADSAISLARAGVENFEFADPTRESWNEVEYRLRRIITSAGVVRISLGSIAAFDQLRLFDTLQRINRGRDVAILLADPVMTGLSIRDGSDDEPLHRSQRFLRILVEQPDAIELRHSGQVSHHTTVITETTVTSFIPIAPQAEGEPSSNGYIVIEADRNSLIRQNNLSAFQRAWDAASPARLTGNH